MEGTAPNKDELASLKEFLQENCLKPGGIEVVIDDLIPRSEAKGRLSRSLALERLDGPPDGETAFLYFLFYDSSLSKEKKAKPVTLMSPYPGAIFVDHQSVNYRHRRLKDFRRRIMLHEAGHALGLCRNAAHGDGLHCTDEKCLMNPTIWIKYRHFLIGGDPLHQKDFCAECRSDLAANRAAEPPANLRFHGSYIIRSEEHYHVVSRPNLIYVHVGKLNEINDTELETLRQKAVQQLDDSAGITYYCTGMDTTTARRVSKALLNDPVQTIRRIGTNIVEQLRQNGEAE